MNFLLDTNILIPLEDSQKVLVPSLSSFIRLSNENGHTLLYHAASEDDIREDKNLTRRNQTLQRLSQYKRLDARPVCPWNNEKTRINDARDNEILYALSLHAAHALVTEDRGIHNKAKELGLVNRVYTIQTVSDLLSRLHSKTPIQLPRIKDIELWALTPYLNSDFFDSLREGYGNDQFNNWFKKKAAEGVRAWIPEGDLDKINAICIYDRQDYEKITNNLVLEGTALKLATFKVGDAQRGRKIGELFLKAAFRYAFNNKLENIFIHGDEDKHHFLFNLLSDFGFEKVGTHPGSNDKDAVYLKKHPQEPPLKTSESIFEYHRHYFPHFHISDNVKQYVIPIKPEFHEILFPDYCCTQGRLFFHDNLAGNAIKMAYLCHAKINPIDVGSVILFYRSEDEQAITSIGIVERCERMTDVNNIISTVKRRTVYTKKEIEKLTEKPTLVILFRFVKHLNKPVSISELIKYKIIKGAPQSITSISHDAFKKFSSISS